MLRRSIHERGQACEYNVDLKREDAYSRDLGSRTCSASQAGL